MQNDSKANSLESICKSAVVTCQLMMSSCHECSIMLWRFLRASSWPNPKPFPLVLITPSWFPDPINMKKWTVEKVRDYLNIIITSVACAVGPSVSYHILNWFFPSKTWFFWNLFEFSAVEITEKSNISHILNPNLTE